MTSKHEPSKNWDTKKTPKTLLQEFKQLAKLWPYLKSDKTLLFWGVFFIPIIAFLLSWRPIIMRYAIDDGITQKNFSILWQAAALFCGMILFEYITRSIQSYCTALATHRMVKKLRTTLVKHVLHMPASFHDKNMSGALVTRSTSDFDNLSESLNQGVLTAIIDLAVLIGCAIGMYTLDAKLATAVIVLLPLMFWLIAIFSKALKATMLAARQHLSQLNGFTQECLYSHTTIKLLSAQKDMTQRFQALGKKYRDVQMRSVIIDASLFALLDGIAAVSIGIIFWVVAINVFELEANGITAGLLIAFVQYAQQVFEPLKQLGSKIAMLQGSFTAIDRIFGLLEEEYHPSGTKKPTEVQGHVRFENITFAYAENPPVLKNISFDLAPGSSTALVGATGSGKTTTIKLLTRMYEGYQGHIYLDENELASIDHQHLRRSIGIVPQDITLFDGSVSFNIGLGRPDITQENIEQAATVVGADKFIQQLPQKFNHIIREQGGNLSHGQRQLIAFARALVGSPSLVILDEATSSVDPESETLIQTAIEKMLQGRSMIIIAHRLATIQRCNKILVFDHGEVVESGRHEELILTNGIYAQLHQKAKKGPAEAGP